MKLIHNISCLAGVLDGYASKPLCGKAMDNAGLVENAWLLVSDSGVIEDYGSGAIADDILASDNLESIDAAGGMVMPAFCDSHSHIVYAGCRAGEFVDKIKGLSYEEIARRGGGILNSADLLATLSEQELYDQSLPRVLEVMRKGTGSLEVKSGYGLTLEGELKMLRVIRRLAESVPVRIKATFLGAHAVGRAFAGRQSDYVDHICRDMLPAVAAEGLADFVDVFCDKDFFTVEETEQILNAAAKYDIRPKIHANELDADWGGVQVGVKCHALSVDHLERSGLREIECLRDSATIPTALPGASFFLNMPYAPGRAMIDAGLPLALASDYNPGSSPSGDMRFVWALGCIKLRLTPAEAFRAVTVNSACAMGIGDIAGSITRGKSADFIITHSQMSDLSYIPYLYNTPFIKEVYLSGTRVN